jgi:hypothetical protein
MTARLPEEEEYEAARAGGGVARPPSRSAARAADPVEAAAYARAMRLIALAMGLAIMVGVAMAAVLVLYWLTGQRWLLLLNIGIVVLAVGGIAYLMYERGKLTMRP